MVTHSITRPAASALTTAGLTWQWVETLAAEALRAGVLQPIATDYTFVEEAEVRFIVRTFSESYQRKLRASTRAPLADGPAVDPFLPYEEALYVADVSPTHVCLFNKYNVLDLHLLIVTRAFEDQDAWLTAADFEAMWICLAALDGLVLYNAGREAGSSQRHRHLQLVRWPLAPQGPPLPVQAWWDAVTYRGEIGALPAFPFRHALTRLDPAWAADPAQAGRATLRRYNALLRAVGLLEDGDPHPARLGGPYNLLATRDWLFVVPRRLDAYASISVNALGYAGSLFVRTPEQMAWLQSHGPRALLQHVSLPR